MKIHLFNFNFFFKISAVEMAVLLKFYSFLTCDLNKKN